MEQTAKPSLKVTGLHVEGLKALRRVDWPADGMGWRGQVPDTVMVGGVNGSGKTTLLEFIRDSVHVLLDWSRLPVIPGLNAWVDLKLVSAVVGSADFRVVMGDEPFVKMHETGDCMRLIRYPHAYAPLVAGTTWGKTHALLSKAELFAASDMPGIIYLPTDRRLAIPTVPYKAAGRLSEPTEFSYRFREAETWDDSLEAILYAARWADLNAKEEGRARDATHFDSYAEAFLAFFGESKSLVWERGELFVKIADSGALHPLMELSSGEKQALILAAELYRHWRPGSLILIDEPELHFHPSWQTTLWLMLQKWQRERGGQVIVTTQSTHLFGVAEPGTTVLLGKGLV